MSAFRDDRELLKQRIEELEQALSHAESRADKGSLETRLATLTERVAAKRADLEEDKKALGELAEALDKMARELRPEAPPVAAPSAAGAQTGRRWMLLGFSALVICAGAFLILASQGEGRPPAPALQGGAERLPGWPSALDPVALLPQMRAQGTRGQAAELGAIEVRYLGSSGRLDVTGKGYVPTLVYRFVRQPPAPPEDSARPLGVPAPPRMAATEYTVTIDRNGVVTETDVIAMLAPPPVAEPTCSTGQVWAAALGRGAPADALASLRYRRGDDGAGRWKFEIEGTDIRFEIADGSCTVVERP